jgi:hypothetical protein
MESIYYVICWNCHRRCRHCYEDRFRPYAHAALDAVIAEAERCAPRIVEHLPPRMTYVERDKPEVERIGRIVLSGGEVLSAPVRERVLHPVLEALDAKYHRAGGVRLIVQTTGDLVTPAIVEALLARGVWMISVAGMDDFHVGLEGERRVALSARLVALFEAAGMRAAGHRAPVRHWTEEDGPVYSFFGATEETWIGKLWPRGRAWANGLSRATLADNFCNAWSGGLGFLDHGLAGSEVSIEPAGAVYPCCLKTALPLGNLVEEPLLDILDSLRDHPAYQAINAGAPQRMGLAAGWSVERFEAACHTTTPQGAPYANLCIGCDHFHAEAMAPVLAEAAAARRRRRLAARAPAELVVR